MLFLLGSQFLKYDLSYFSYSGKAGKGRRKFLKSFLKYDLSYFSTLARLARAGGSAD